MKLKYSLMIMLFLSTIVPLSLGFVYLSAYVSAQQKIQVEDNLEAITTQAKALILASVAHMKDSTSLVSSRTQLRRSLQNYLNSSNPDDLDVVERIIRDAGASILSLREISIFDLNGQLIASTSASSQAISHIPNEFPHISLSEQAGTTLLNGVDVLSVNNKAIALIKVSVVPSFIDDLLRQRKSLGKTGEWIVAVNNGDKEALFVSPTRYFNEGAFNRTVPFSATEVPIIAALSGKQGIIWDAVDYAGVDVVAATAYIPEYQWGVVAKINKHEVFADLRSLQLLFSLVLLGVLVLTLVCGWYLSKYITRPIESLTDQVNASKNTRNTQLFVHANWQEVKLLSARFNDLLSDVQSLNASLNEKVLARTTALMSTNNELLLAKEKAEQATKAKAIFLANMSHELRTPLNSIHGSLQLLERAQLDEKNAQLVSVALRSMTSLLAIINDVLDFSKIEDNSITLEEHYFDFSSVVAQVVSELNLLALDKNILLSHTIANTYREGWLGDAQRIKQVLVNFVSNAIKFTDQGRVDLYLDIHPTKGLVFSVQDTGIGMSPENVAKIFDRFTQADESISRRFGGTGLGMPISLGLVKLMGGDIQVSSELGKGTFITTHLPLEKVAPPQTPVDRLISNKPPNLSSKRILLAEDNEINQVIFTSMMEETDAKLTVVNNGQEALSTLENHEFDMIFLDIQMPVLDGIETCRQIQAKGYTTPLVAITANVSAEDTQLYTNIGFEYHIGKPVDLGLLYSVLATLNES